VFQQLINHNEDLKKLVKKGYAVSFDNNCLLIRDIPYLDSEKKLNIGAIIAKLVFKDQFTVVQDDHQIYFAGGIPHEINGIPITNLGGGPYSIPLSSSISDVKVERSFSNKPKINDGKFTDFFEKIENYVTILSGPAMELYDVTPYTFRINDNLIEDSVFKIRDTLTSRAEILDLSQKFKNEIVAIIGLGGTGAYLLDFLAKTPVKEILAFDNDQFHIHNVFRSPGKFDLKELDKKKGEVYHARYENFRHGLIVKSLHIDESSFVELNDVTFAFVCVDNGPSRKSIFNLLISKKIPFLDVGMGLKRRNELLNGMMRVTYYSSNDAESTKDKGFSDISSEADDIYRTNIQIAELNALNASLAIIRYKQLKGFYSEDYSNDTMLFEICDMRIIGESLYNENQT
jgi:hypothetical protein